MANVLDGYCESKKLTVSPASIKGGVSLTIHTVSEATITVDSLALVTAICKCRKQQN